MIPPRSSPAPVISVTLPNYNYGRFLEESLLSVLNQTYPHFEILYVDDGSTDNSVEIAKRLAAQDARIKPVYFEKNRGALVAHADTWSRVAGEIVYQFSSDDALSDPDFFRLGVEALGAHPHAAGFFGAAQMISTETGADLGLMGRATPGYIAPEPFLRGFLARGFFVPGISSLWRTSAIHAVGGYDTRLGPQTDYFINHALPSLSGVVFSPRQFARARVSEARASFSSSAKLEDELKRLALFSTKMRNLNPRMPTMEAEWNHWRREQAQSLFAKYAGPNAQAVG